MLTRSDAFTSAAWGRTIWGSESDQAALEEDFAQLRSNFTDIPVVIGEWLVSPIFSEPAARWNYYDFISRTATSFGFAMIIWDNGNDHLDRESHTWRDPTSISVHQNALIGVNNSLPISTIDYYSKEQLSSAFIFHRIGDEIKSSTLQFHLNGNLVMSISDGTSELLLGGDYHVSDENIIISAFYLSNLIQTEDPGTQAILQVSFSSGTSMPVYVIQWDVPTVQTDHSQAIEGSNLQIDIEWHGLKKPAAVAAYKADGSYLVDEWTNQLGPLEQGRTTYGGQ